MVQRSFRQKHLRMSFYTKKNLCSEPYFPKQSKHFF